MPQPDPTRLAGPGIERRPEVGEVLAALHKLGIDLDRFGFIVTAVYLRPRPYGFDFDCRLPRQLLEFVKQLATFKEDDTDTAMGRFMAKDTHGTGFRQKGFGPGVHLEVAMDGACNAHIDSHGPVSGVGSYDFNHILEHGYWDLAPDEVPGAYGSFGDRGKFGPAIRPMKGPDDRIHWMIGFTGEW